MRNVIKISQEVQMYLDYLNNPETAVIDPEVRERVKRLNFAVDLVAKYGPSSKKAYKIHKDKFSVDQSTIRRDFYTAVQISGATSIYNKDFCRFFAIMQAEKAMIMCLKSNKFKEFNQALKNYIEASGIKHEDPDIPDYESEKIREVIIRIHPDMADKRPNKELEDEIKKLIAPPKSNDDYYNDIQDAQIIP